MKKKKAKGKKAAKKAKPGFLGEEALAEMREREEQSPAIREAKRRAKALKKRKPKKKRGTQGKGFGLQE